MNMLLFSQLSVEIDAAAFLDELLLLKSPLCMERAFSAGYMCCHRRDTKFMDPDSWGAASTDWPDSEGMVFV